MKIAIINYGYGNLHSVNQAFQKANKDFDLDAKIEVTNKPNEIDTADKIVLPGVGSFFDCLSAVKSINGILESLQDQVINKQKKFMGICVGMQLLADIGYENGENNHHIIESCFKALARSLRQAVAIDDRVSNNIPSTKGQL